MNSTMTAMSLLLGIVLANPAAGQDAGAEAVSSPEVLFSRFAEGWNEGLWQQNFREIDRYMRAENGHGWQLRMRTMQQLVGHGQEAVPVLLRTLESGSTPQRILAAQSLGYLAPWVPAEPLIRAAKSDSEPAVRLYSVDALGMTGRNESTVDWKVLQKAETNRDVRRHIDYAVERNGKTVESIVIRELKEWDSASMNTAQVGSPAPDFTLKAATGETVSLSDFRGQKSVVLVFIYGDT